MKKLFFLILILSGFYTASYAQYYNQRSNAQTPSRTEIGLDFGYNGASVSQPYDYYGSAEIGGFNAGISVDYMLAPFWSLKIKAIYDQKGWANGYLVDNDGNVFNNVNFKLNYITVPVLANWHLGQAFYMNFGPYVGFLLDAHDAYTGTDVKSAFNTVDGGLAFGLGVKLPITNAARIFFEYDSQAGFANIIADNQGNSLVNYRYSFNVGLSFPVK